MSPVCSLCLWLFPMLIKYASCHPRSEECQAGGMNSAACQAVNGTTLLQSQHRTNKTRKMKSSIGGVKVYNYHLSRDDQNRWLIGTGTLSNGQLRDICAHLPGHALCTEQGHPSDGGVGFIAFHGSEAELEETMTSVEGVEFVEPDLPIYAIPEVPDEPAVQLMSLQTSVPWGLDRIDDDSGLDGSYNPGATGSGVHVYVLDTGVRTTHDDFGGRAIPTLDMVGGTTTVCNSWDTNCAKDPISQGHGTHCAGSVGGSTYGVAKEATLHSVRVLGEGGGFTSWITGAMDWVVINGDRPAVISMSLGGSGTSQAYSNAINDAMAAGVAVVVAAGNENSNACNFSPAFAPNAITVGATDSNDKRASFSNYGSCVDIFGPGRSILSAIHTSDSGSTTMSGTSMACPHVAGAAALLLGSNPSMSAQDVASTLIANAVSGVSDRAGSPNLLLHVGGGSGPTRRRASPTRRRRSGGGGGCQDSTTYTDPQFSDPCSSWAGFNCEASQSGTPWPFKDELKANCPVACNANCDPAAGGFTVRAGDLCTVGTVNGKNCAMSPNYPSRYAKKQECVISVTGTPGAIEVEEFSTEANYDKLNVNGQDYDGSSGPDGVVPNQDISWTSDTSSESKGWKICVGSDSNPSEPTPQPTPTRRRRRAPTPAPTPTRRRDASAGGLSVRAGDLCTVGIVNGKSCATSPNYPSNYLADQECVISLTGTPKALEVEEFSTEADWDKLNVNGQDYAGSNGPDGAVPNQAISWSSDGSVQGKGWKICVSGGSNPNPSPEPAPTPAPTPAPPPAPTPIPTLPACPTGQDNPQNFDCDAGLINWANGWSSAKKTFCCTCRVCQ